MTAAIINITSIGGAVGCKPKTNVSIPNPTPPMTPSPMPPKRAPIIMAVRTNANFKWELVKGKLPAGVTFQTVNWQELLQKPANIRLPFN